jgi:serine/threonine-protein kinase
MADESQEYDPPTLDIPAPGGNSGQVGSASDSAASLRNQPLPLQDWERYQIVEFLGAGAMGTVYKARDPRLNRFVALKFIRDNTVGGELAQRFYREARSQAGIEHEYVCKIYEVGEVEGRPYIAMQYIDGETLNLARNKMTLPQKVKAIREAAEALHAAHRYGMIHRDVKPGNIMVEPTPEGGFRPYVLDFGLADLVQTTGGLLAPGLEGTPAYMSPEQARGEMQLLDRRTDVYSLGATLYDLLAGQPPFGKGPNDEILLSLLVAEPKPLRDLKHGVPADLDAVVMKCLEKDPADRYESAKALADDLMRYLDGEAVMARRSSLVYRLQKKAQKNKILVATLVVAALAIIVLSTIFIRARVQAAEQARLAQQSGQKIKEIEIFMRYAYALPLHDTSVEKAVIRARMASISQDMARLDGEAAAMAHYALGRGHLALQEYEKALEYLKLAHAGGLRTPAVEYALGRTLGEIYNKQFKEVLRRSGKRMLQAKAKIDKDLLEPALHHLRQSGGEHGESRPLAEGLLAYYSQQYEEALKKGQDALTAEPWLYEAKKLQADVYYAYGRRKQNSGQYQEARSDYRRAAELYHGAAEMARSDSSIHSAEADTWVQIMELDKTQGLSPKEAYERALEACDRAIVSFSENDSAVRKKVWAMTRWAEYLSTHGQDPRSMAQQAIETAQRAYAMNPNNAFPHDQIGLAYQLIANYENDHGLDSTESEKKAIEAFSKSIEINRNFAWALNDYGVLFATKAEWLGARGQDYRNEMEQAIEKLNAAIEADPDYHVAYSNLAHSQQLMATYEIEHGRSPDEWIDKAIETSTRSLQVNPNYYQTYRNLASVFALRAKYELSFGRTAPAAAALAKAHEALNQAIKANPEDAETHRVLAAVYELEAETQSAQKQDPQELLSRGLQAIQKSILISPNDSDSLLLHVQLLLLQADELARAGTSPLLLLQQANGVAVRARDVNSKNALVYLSFAQIARTGAEWQVSRRKSPEKDLADGQAAIDQALQLNPNLAQALATRGSMYLLAARTAPAGLPRKLLSAQAAIAIKQALAKSPLLARKYDALLGEAVQLSESLSAAERLQLGGQGQFLRGGGGSGKAAAGAPIPAQGSAAAAAPAEKGATGKPAEAPAASPAAASPPAASPAPAAPSPASAPAAAPSAEAAKPAESAEATSFPAVR